MKRAVALGLMLIAGCGKSKPAEKKEPVAVQTGPGSGSGSGSGSGNGQGSGSDTWGKTPPPPPPLDLAGIDKSVKPGDDFFAYANGTWFKTTEIPPDRSAWGAGAQTVDITADRVVTVIQEAVQSAPAGSDARKVADYYTTFLDEAAIEKLGIAPLQAMFDRVKQVTDTKTLSRAIGETLRADVDAINNTSFETSNLFGLWIAQDLNDPAKYAVYLLQGGLVMPSRDYYLEDSARMKEMREAYRKYIFDLLKLSGYPVDPDAAAGRILALEEKIAKVHASRVESEDVKNGTLRWSRADLDKKAPGLDWGALLEGAQLGKVDTFAIWHAKATTGLSALVKSEPLDAWKDWLAFHMLDSAAWFLPKAFVEEAFAFHGKALAGTPQLSERWKRAVDATSEALGEAVGRLYVTKYFPPEAKAKIEALVGNLMVAFDKRIDALAWMAPATKAKAKAKLKALKVAVGYPDKWRDYSTLEIKPGDALGNWQRAGMFEYQRNLKKLGTPVDRDEWVMTPQLVNAVNLPAMNALNFPAAILQPPYFDPSRPAVMDYGSIGSIIGHEISHSFDDQGAQFDETGKLANWWTKEDFAHFKQQGEALAAQYDAYKPFPDLAINGKQTLSENIADVAGLAAAYDAYRLSLGGKEAPAWNGLTGDQQFFLAFAQGWRTKYREPALRRRVLTDGHSPGEYRADTVRNQDAWYTAFGVKEGEKLYLAPDKRVRVW